MGGEPATCTSSEFIPTNIDSLVESIVAYVCLSCAVSQPILMGARRAVAEGFSLYRGGRKRQACGVFVQAPAKIKLLSAELRSTG